MQDLDPQILRAAVEDFYSKVFKDPMIGFHFKGRDQAHLITREIEFLMESVTGQKHYTGRPMGPVHRPLKIMGGHFNRRQVLLREALERNGIPQNLVEKMIEHNESMRPVITGDAIDECAAQPSFSNRLLLEKSPYLLQHAYNPVDWYPWGGEAFEKARSQNKPIFLSIGYSTCHWCHVMERESFESIEIAEVLNREFVSIKVDREERPDVDEIYMTTLTHVLGRGGGWPLSAFLTPSADPFFAGTYFPPKDFHGRPGFKTLLLDVARAWKEKRKLVEDDALKIKNALAQIAEQESSASTLPMPKSPVVERILSGMDTVWGGLGSAPKFPQVACLELLFALKTYSTVHLQLEKMFQGGIYDHLGGGFSRYSTDERWHVPHFEKMLYDNAQLIEIYSKMYPESKNKNFKKVVEETIAYVFRDLRGKHAAFFTAEDADSEGVEGKFYVWTRAEIDQILGERAEGFCKTFGVKAEGNWEHESGAHADETLGQNVLFLKVPEAGDFTPERKKLLEVRSRRPRPLLDDKILTGWNGLMISALSVAGRVFERADWIDAAIRSAEWIRAHLTHNGQLLRRFRDGEAKGEGTLEDYAYLVQGLIELGFATGSLEWMRWARDLSAMAIKLFYNEKKAAFFSAGVNDPFVRVRMIHLEDGACPSASAIQTLNLARLGRYFDLPEWTALAEKAVAQYQDPIERFPIAYSTLHRVKEFLSNPGPDLVFVPGATSLLKSESRENEDWRRELLKTWHWGESIWDLNPEAQESRELRNRAELAKNSKNRPCVLVCQGFACKNPITTLEDLKKEREI